MLQRAASNACSWWWASHIRTKQSKWLEQSLQDMEEKVHNMLKLIEEDGDSFIKRAEMYYKRRPELISAIEDTYRAFKALADRYDLLSKELQNANNTIATVFPEQVQLAMEAEDDQSSTPPPKSLKNLQIKSSNIPKVPKASMESLKGFINTASKQFQHKKSYKTASKPKPRTRPLPTSGLSKDEALLEINKVNKEILALQTIKEFCKSSYENGLKKFYEIENQIVEMQEKVIKLQDEYDVEGVIDDGEARTLMAETALKSCKETLSSLQEKQQQSNEEAKDEFKKIEEAREQLEALRRDCAAETESEAEEHAKEDEAEKSTKKNKGEDITSGFIQELNDIDTLTSEKSFDMGSTMALTVTQLAEKIDLLVNKVVNLETAVSSQTVLINTMRSESDELRSQIKQLESDKEKLSGDARTLRMRIKELEDKLSRLEELNTNVEAHNIKLEANFAHCRCSLDHLSERLTSVKPDEEAEESDSSHTKHGKSKKKKDKKEKKDGEHKSKKKKHKDKKKDKDKDKKEDVHIQEEDDDSNLHKEEDEDDEEEEIKEINEVVLSPKESSNDQIQSLPSPKESLDDQSQSLPSPRDITLQKEEEEVIKDQKEEEIKDEKETVEIQTAVENEGKEEDLTSSKTEEKQKLSEIPSLLKESEVSKPVRRSITFSGELTKARLNMDDPTKEGGKAQEDDSDLSWQQMLLNGAEDRDKILLREYTTILRNYKDVKRKLMDTEKKERDIQFDITMQMRELKQAIMKRDQEIQQLRHELSLLRGEKDTKKEGGGDYHDPPTGKSESVNQTPKPESTVDESGKPESGTEDSEAEEKEDDIKLMFKVKTPGVSVVEERLRMEIDAILDENLDFWLRFSTAFHQVQKYKNEAQDLMEEIAKLRAKKKQEGGMTQQLKSEVRPIYKHLREIQTELTVWLEQRVCLKDELKRRFTSLCSIQEEITTALKEGVEEEEIRFSSHQAAKLQGEILSMKQENNKVREELQACLDHVSVLQLDIEKTLRQLNQEFSICTDQPQLQHAISRSKIPLRSFIFGTKVKKQKSLFNFMHANRKLHAVRALPSS